MNSERVKGKLGITHFRLSDARDTLRVNMAAIVPAHIITLTPEMCVRASTDPEFRKIIENAGMVIADGIGVVWGEEHLGGTKPDKIPGVDLATWALEEADRMAGRIFLLGAKPNIVEKAVQCISFQYPRLSITGYHHGYFSADEEPQIVEKIRLSEPHLLLVGMGSPRQEEFIARYLPDLNCGAAMGVGGTIDILASAVRRAPEIFRRSGTEWIYRILTQPGSRLKRLPTLLKFVILVFRQGISM